MALVELNVEGMSCQHCENVVRSSIASLKGVDNVDVSLHDNMVSVEFDPMEVTEDDIINTIQEKGYDVV